MERTEARKLAIFSSLLSLALWVFLSLHWWAHLEGDSPIYPLMSVEILGGRNYVMTPGQAHGGALLAYVRALFFSIFGITHFLGFFVNGIVAAIGAFLWTRFTALAFGKRAGLIAAVLFAFCTERFARAACTDYFVITLVTGGILVNAALAYAKGRSLGSRDAFLLGLLVGFSWYLCRFAALYVVTACSYYLALVSVEARAAFIPSRKELSKSVFSKLLLTAVAVLGALTMIAFFASDRFLGINAESNLKTTLLLAVALWSLHRWKVVAKSARLLLFLAIGAVIGLLPEIIFKLMTQHKDRVTGLVRFEDIAARSAEIPHLLGVNFNFYEPVRLGLLALAAYTALILLTAFQKGKGRTPGAKFSFVLLPVLVILGAWFGVHTYMHLSPQYFFPLFFPLFVAVAVAATRTRYSKAAFALLAIPMMIALSDHISTSRTRNHYEESGMLQTLDRWQKDYGIYAGMGDYPSHLDISWASKGRFVLTDWREETRFPQYEKAIGGQKYVFVARLRDDLSGLPPMAPEHFELVEKAHLKPGFEALLYRRK